MGRKIELIKQGYVPQALAARCLGITPQGVARLIELGHLKAVKRAGWVTPVIPIESLVKAGRKRGLSKAEVMYEIKREVLGFWGALFAGEDWIEGLKEGE